MNIIDLTNIDFPQDRKDLRKYIIDLFVSEEPGTGRNELASRNRYVVKKIENHIVFLQRPAQFNKGIDFTLNVTNINFNLNIYNENGKLKRATTRPGHDHIITDLKNKKQENNILYNELFLEIERIYYCKTPLKTSFNFNDGHKTEIVLECLKWLFIEQDITYWHYSGRAMFYGGICGI